MNLSIIGKKFELQTRPKPIKKKVCIVYKKKIIKKSPQVIENCSICTKPLNPILSKIKTLSCHEKHVFHFSCIRRWEIISKKKFCPYCRERYN
jgi:hypothetical protein